MRDKCKPKDKLIYDLVSRVKATHIAYRKKIKSVALPYESINETEKRLCNQKSKDLDSKQQPHFLQHITQKKIQTTVLHSPLKHNQQPNFFIPNLHNFATKDTRNLMDVALFRLSKRDKRAGKIIRYQLANGYVEVKAGPDGMASIWDYDIVLMLVSHLTESMNLYKAGRGKKPELTFVLHVRNIAKFCHRNYGGRQIDEIEAALDRLLGTTIKSVNETTLNNGKYIVREAAAEGLIGPYRVISRTDTGKVAYIEIKAPNWLYREITSGEQPDVLTVHPDYFLIEPGLGRFVYRLARRAAGKNRAKWAFKSIYDRSGSSGSFKEFCRILRRLIASNDLPEYQLKEEFGQVGPLLVIKRQF